MMQILGVVWIELDCKLVVLKSLFEIGCTIKSITTMEKQRRIGSITFNRIRKITNCISKVPHVKRSQPTIVQVFGVFFLLDSSAEALSGLFVLLLLDVRQPQIIACLWIVLGIRHMLFQVLDTQFQVANLPVANATVKTGLGRLFVVVVKRLVEIVDRFVELFQIVVDHTTLDEILFRLVMLVAQRIIVIVECFFGSAQLSKAIPAVAIVHCISIFKPDRHAEIEQSPLVLEQAHKTPSTVRIE
mmetsp:Transcript_52727/g.115612  ORF Transcript_52727/g.115612 Transcript_52727/m.115612 type:complete len:244 (+) Transcript_52727:1116-1847(+)